MKNPKHVAIIMDGNGRWATHRSRPRIFGHIKGARVAKKIISHCARKELKYLTLYAFSSENWLRPKNEVQFLMMLLQRYLKREIKSLLDQNIRFQVIGDRTKLPSEVLDVVLKTESATAANTGMNLTFAISYGSRDEIANSVKNLIKKIQSGELSVEDIDEANIHQELLTADMPDPDLIIRTSGEKRLSNFLLWQAAYSEFYFCDTLWPDFTEQDMDIALLDYLKRDRRFGAVENENTHH